MLCGEAPASSGAVSTISRAPCGGQGAGHLDQPVFVQGRQFQRTDRQASISKRAGGVALIGVEQPVAGGAFDPQAIEQDHGHAQRQHQRRGQPEESGRVQVLEGLENPCPRETIIVNCRKRALTRIPPRA